MAILNIQLETRGNVYVHFIVSKSSRTWV